MIFKGQVTRDREILKRDRLLPIVCLTLGMVGSPGLAQESPLPSARAAGVRISMDGRGRCLNNIFIERLRRSLKYEAVYLHDLTDGFEARRFIDEWVGFYNTERPPSALDGKTPVEAYHGDPPVDMMDKLLRALAHIPTGAATAAGRSIQGDFCGMSDNRNTP